MILYNDCTMSAIAVSWMPKAIFFWSSTKVPLSWHAAYGALDIVMSCHGSLMHHDGTKFHAPSTPGNVEQITPVQEAVRIARDSVPTQTTTSRKPRTKPTGAVCWSHLLEPWQSCTSSLVSDLDETWGARNQMQPSHDCYQPPNYHMW